MWRKHLAGRLLCEREWQRWLCSVTLSHKQLEELEENCCYEAAIVTTPLQCNRCGNKERERFHYLPNEQIYCVECLNMGRVTSGERLRMFTGLELLPQWQNYLCWQGNLTESQERISQLLVEHLSGALPQLVWAVTGAGKTEMMYPVIHTILEQGGRVGVASPRIDVCLELAPRLARDFSCQQQLLYGSGETTHHDCPITICTTHQLWRFWHYFDLLIVDEVDAFPYVNSKALHYGVQRAVKEKVGRLIFLTATPDEVLHQQVKNGEVVLHCLWRRYHGFDLPEPTGYFVWGWRRMIEQGRGKLFRYLERFMAIEGVKLIFVPSIPLAERLAEILSDKHAGVNVVHAQDINRKSKVEAVRRGECDVLVSTSILERGVTFTNCHVCIVGADSSLFNVAALVQMSGRVGRSKDFPTGTLWWIHSGWTKMMHQAKKQIHQMNSRKDVS